MCSIPDDFGDQKNILRDQNSGKRGNVKHSSRFCSFFSLISTLPVYLKVKATSYMAIRSPQVRDVEPVDGVFPGFPLTLCTRQSISTYYTIASISFHIYQNQFYPDDQSEMIGFLSVICSNHLQLCPIYPTLVHLQAGHGPWESLGYLLSNCSICCCLCWVSTF